MKRYNEYEREYLYKQLREEAKDCLRQFGAKRTPVEEFLTRANIPTGTFYLFYPSKEHLFYEVICDYRKELILKCHSMLTKQTPLTSEYFTQVLFMVMRESMDSFLFYVAKNNEIEYILRKLPTELIEKNEGELISISEGLLAFLPPENALDFETLLTSFETLFYSSVRKSKIGEELFYNSLWVLLGSLADNLMNKDRSGVGLMPPKDRPLFI